MSCQGVFWQQHLKKPWINWQVAGWLTALYQPGMQSDKLGVYFTENWETYIILVAKNNKKTQMGEKEKEGLGQK